MTLAQSMSELPQQLQDLKNDNRLGLVSVRPGGDGILPYTSVSRLPFDTAALEIPHEDPYLTENPGITFDQLLAEYGCTSTTAGECTYVFPVETDDSLEQRAFEDLDVIYGLADAGLVAMAIDDVDRVEDALTGIRDLAEEWHDPDSDAWETYDQEIDGASR
ncbi:hypothetical protein HUG10_21240 (plasmid) [Halorarum halophilum]|uniref:Uncharacterized protein n=1 Tax=Halorarum halophilum TaxID=2743090 RepID=A0A7D5KAS4_9EURY|nr:hypothetical protein [Halobaculum halophilum]QLG30114.1 hypothetical protein HUG10_21240 [Halobaculum halophilum]